MTLVYLGASMAAPAIAGGNHHKTVLVPVQAAAPVQFATVQAAAPVQYTQVQAAAPVQYMQVQAQAAAPVQFVQAQAAAPVQYVPMQAAAPVQYVPMQAAAPVQLLQMQAAAPVKPAKAGAAPVAGAPSGRMQVNVGGRIFNLVPAGASSAAATPGVAASPTDDDGLSDDDRAKILSALAPFVVTYKGLINDDGMLRSAVRSKASDLYAKTTGNDADSSDAASTIDSIVDEALGTAPPADDRTSNAATATAAQPQAPQQFLVPVAPVAAAAAPMQLFLPVKVKHHAHIR